MSSLLGFINTGRGQVLNSPSYDSSNFDKDELLSNQKSYLWRKNRYSTQADFLASIPLWQVGCPREFQHSTYILWLQRSFCCDLNPINARLTDDKCEIVTKCDKMSKLHFFQSIFELNASNNLKWVQTVLKVMH